MPVAAEYLPVAGSGPAAPVKVKPWPVKLAMLMLPVVEVTTCVLVTKSAPMKMSFANVMSPPVAIIADVSMAFAVKVLPVEAFNVRVPVPEYPRSTPPAPVANDTEIGLLPLVTSKPTSPPTVVMMALDVVNVLPELLTPLVADRSKVLVTELVFKCT